MSNEPRISQILSFIKNMAKGDFTSRLPESTSPQNDDFDGLDEVMKELNHLAEKQQEREEAQHPSEVKRHLTQEILNQMHDGVIVTDQEAIIVDWAGGAERMFGYTKADVLGKTPSFLHHPEDRRAVKRTIQGFLAKDGTWKGEINYVAKDGSEGISETLIVPLLDENGTTLFNIGFNRDVTERKFAEVALQQAKEQAEKANRAKSEFLAKMSHEIRTPLGAIMGFNQILLDQSKNTDLPENFQKFLENISSSSIILSQLINNVLDLSKIEAGKMELVEEDVHVETLVKYIMDTYSFQASQKEIHFSYSIDASLPHWIQIDQTKLMQILTNLVGNALKFTSSGKKITIQVLGDQQIIAFLVIDQGIGISAAQQEIIFRAFEQAESSTSQKYGGTGLGLAITKGLVDLMGGKIMVTSQLGQGSTFNVVLPFQQQIETGLTDSQDPPPDAETTVTFSADNTILVVEDNMINQELIRAILEDWGLKPVFADTGEEGIVKTIALHAKGESPNIILMDMQLPGISGIEAFTQIRARPETKDVPVVALSADAFSEQRSEALKIGMDGYLTKPVDLAKLLKFLNKYLD